MPGISPTLGIPFTVSQGGANTAPASDTINLTFSDNATDQVDVGNVATDLAILITYCATRGATYQMGSIFILNDGVPDYSWDYFGDDIGMTLSASVDAADIFLDVTVDNSSADDVEFDYITERITLT